MGSQEMLLAEQPDRALLDWVNETVVALGWIGKFRELPKLGEWSMSLRGKRIAYLDDSKLLLCVFAPYFVSATCEKPELFHYRQGDNVDKIARRMRATNPDLLLVDYRLGGDIYGSEVVRALRLQGYAGAIIGFSSDSDCDKDFRDAGVNGLVLKDGSEPMATMEKLAAVAAAR